MTLADEIVRRLVVSKQLVVSHGAQLTPQSGSVAVARAVLAAHDSMELAVAAIATAISAQVTDRMVSITEYPQAIERARPGTPFPGRQFVDNLNRARRNFKHAGLMPNVEEWYTVLERAEGWIEEWCTLYLGVDFQQLDLSSLLASEEVRLYYAAAARALGERQYQAALEAVGRALYSALRSFPGIVYPIVGGGESKTDEALLLSTFGVNPSAYLTVQKFLPTVYQDLALDQQRVVVEWKTREFGNPANWTAANVKFCLDTVLDIALKIQNAPPVPTAVHFRWVYDDVITPAIQAPVALWRYDAQGISLLTGGLVKGPTVYTLQPGERLRCAAQVAERPTRGLADLLDAGDVHRAAILALKAEAIPGGPVYVERELVEISYAPKANDPFADHWLPSEPA